MVSVERLERRASDLEREKRWIEAREAFDDILRRDPASKFGAEGRARIALALKEETAAEHCSRALAFHDHDPELQAQMIAVVASQLGSAAIPLMERYLERNPQHIAGNELLADLRAQAGAGDKFADSYITALSTDPTNKPLMMSYWNMLTRSGRHLQALESMDNHRAVFEGEREFAMLEIAVSGHAGLPDRARRLLEGQDARPDAELARGLNCLQTARPDEAAKRLEGVVIAQPENFEAWSLLEVAWRLIDDPRHSWLLGDIPLYGTSQTELSSLQLSLVADMLRGLHKATAQPIGQSVRGGTQTSGQLFIHDKPEMTMLKNALAEQVRRFVTSLPEADAKHPLLKYRDDGIAFGPSWSVRFTGSGHHAAHFHSGGIFSSACYIVVPDGLGDPEEQAGWLELGRPPPELGLDLPPLATFEPKPGRLVLFPSFLFHGTRPFSGGERLSVAFDLVPVPMS